jgi:hypothetical protein
MGMATPQSGVAAIAAASVVVRRRAAYMVMRRPVKNKWDLKASERNWVSLKS